MIKKLLAGLALLASMSMAFAQVEVNKADAAALDGIKGIGPAKSKAIIDERTKNGDFKDWSDFQHRIKGVKDKTAAKLSANGLQVNGKPFEGAAVAKTEKKAAK
ncbi:MAG: ComEA family DNA-binding protein [Telluria sp.]